MVPTGAASASGDYQEVDLEKLVHLRAKNALWRSWSIEGLSEAAAEEEESVGSGAGKRQALKPSPKAWEVFYERFLLDIGDTSLALELSRRHHGAPDIASAVRDTAHEGRRSTTDVDAPSDSGEAEGAVRGGQLFGHLAGSGGGGGGGGGGSACSGGYGSGDDGSDHFVGMMRADSGGSELAFGLELSGSYDQRAHRRRLRSSSVGSVDNSVARHWPNDKVKEDIDDNEADHDHDAINIKINHRLSDPILREGLDDDGAAGRMNLLRKTFTQARNQRRLDVPNDTVSAFLGDDLSVHHNNYFGASWGARSGSAGSRSGGGSGGGGSGGGTASFDISGVGGAAAGGGGGTYAHFAHGRQLRHQQQQQQGITGLAGNGGGGAGGGGGSREGLFKKTRNILSLGDLRGAAASSSDVATSAPAEEGSKQSARQKEREDSAGALAALLASSGQVKAAAAAAAAAGVGTPAATHESTAEPVGPAGPGDESAGRSGTGAGGAAASPANNSGGALPGGTSAGSPRFLRDAFEQQQQRQKEEQGLGKRAPPRPPSGEAVGGMAGMRRSPATAGGGGGGGFGGIGAKSTSALDRLVQEQDRGQAVMMPLMNWDDWTPDRLHWTFPAVVHAFPRCLYDVADTSERRSGRTGALGSHGGARRDLDPPAIEIGGGGGCGSAVAAAFAAAGGQGSGRMLEVGGDWEMEMEGEGEGEGAGGGRSSRGNNGEDARGGQALQQQSLEQSQAHTQAQAQAQAQAHQQQVGEEEEEAKGGAEQADAQAEDEAAAAAAAESPSLLPSPFQPFTLGEVYIRAAPASDLAPAGVESGPWRRRWLVLRQTYVFELLQPPAASTLSWGDDTRAGGARASATTLCPPADGAAAPAPAAAAGGSESRATEARPKGGARGGDEERGQRGGGGSSEDDDESSRRKVRKIERIKEDGLAQEHEEQQQQQQQPGGVGRRPEKDGDRYVAPVGFMCLSKASVGYGGINWGPKTLLLRCQSRPADMSREEASIAAGCGGGGGGDASVRAGTRGKEIHVELRVPSEEVGERWTALFRDRAALEMSSLFEPSPGDSEEYAEGDAHNASDSSSTGDGGGDGSGGGHGGGYGGGGEVQMRSDSGFSVLGTGRFSRVVWARRKQPWARTDTNVCAIKIVDKQAFWSRVRTGKERVDTLAREVFCQTTLTIKGADDEDDGDGDGGLGSDVGVLGSSLEERFGEPSSPRRPSGAEAATEGGGIVRVHSIFETANDLILEMDLMSRTDLFDRLLELNGAFTERETAGMAHNLLLAIDKCNRLGFCHRDVKLSNLLYPGPASSHGHECVLLADFGMATTAGRDGLVRGRCGTSGFVAPEILKAGKQEGYGMNVDIFSAGVVLYVCLCGYEPFFGVTEKDLIAANKEAVFGFPAAEWDDVSDGAKDLIRKMMESDPSKRITPQDALRHPWIVQHQKKLH